MVRRSKEVELTRRHIDAALYGLSPPKVTTLYAVKVPGGEPQVCRYDVGTGDELKVPLGGTACKSPNSLRGQGLTGSRQRETHV